MHSSSNQHGQWELPAGHVAHYNHHHHKGNPTHSHLLNHNDEPNVRTEPQQHGRIGLRWWSIDRNRHVFAGDLADQYRWMLGCWIYVDLSLSRLLHDSSNESRELELECCFFNASHHRRESNPVPTLNCPHRNHRGFSKNVATLIVWRIWKRCGELHARICGFRRLFADWCNA